MKKIFLVLLMFCILIYAAIYFLIPQKIYFAKAVYVKTNLNSVKRFLYDENNWDIWWPGVSELNSDVHKFKNYEYTIQRKMYEGMDIIIKHDGKNIPSFLHLVSANRDSTAIEWKGEMEETNNAIKKMYAYFFATQVKQNISEILASAKVFLEKKENIYGYNINQEKVKDTLLISTKYFSKTRPSTENIYTLIKKLKEYISAQGASETNYPMLNITQDSSEFKTMVAIPINKNIAENQTFVIKKMVPGKILVAEIKGGQHTVKEATDKVNIYMEDNHLVAPAISFESLISDRVKEKDTTKWITKIYFPIY